jgi:hypothetical protein
MDHIFPLNERSTRGGEEFAIDCSHGHYVIGMTDMVPVQA